MKKTTKKVAVVGAGVAALAAAAAGAYFMTGKNAGNRKKLKSWASKMKKEVMDNLETAQKSGKKAYHQAVDLVAKNYSKMKNISAEELAAATAELKSSWDSIRTEVSEAAQTVKKIAPKTIKTVAKSVKVKTVPKTVSKKSPKPKTKR